MGGQAVDFSSPTSGVCAFAYLLHHYLVVPDLADWNKWSTVKHLPQ